MIRRPENCAPLVTPLRSRGTYSLWCRKGKAFCEHAFALHRQQHGKDEQKVDVPPLEKFLWTPMLLT